MSEHRTHDEPQSYEFEITGGALCLDFANTVSERAQEEPVERLESYGDLLSWAGQAAALPAARRRELATAAARRPEEAERLIERARVLREALFHLFAGLAAGARPGDEAWRRDGLGDDLETLHRELPAALARLRLAAADGNEAGDAVFHWTWQDGDDLAAPLWPVLRSAADLLTGDDLDRLRECDSADCRWLFLDRSRNRSRRWCDMQVCGNRAKARRHYRRQKSAG